MPRDHRADITGPTEAAVAYEGIRPRFQQVRAGIAVLLLAVGISGYPLGAQGGWLGAAGPGLILADALVRIGRPGRALPSFLIDALAGGLMVGVHGGYMSPLIALLTYLMAGTLLLVPQPGTIWSMALAGGAASAAALGVGPAVSVKASAAFVIWAEASLLMVATGLVLLAGITAVRAANRRQNEALEAERRASEIKSDFVAMVTHELRTPLTTISGFIETLKEMWRDVEPDEVDEFLAIISGEAEKLAGLVEDVLAIPKLEAGRLLVDVTDFALRPLTFRIADRMFPAGGEKAASVEVAGNVIVRADPNRVEQILCKLLDNARKHGGDSIRVTAMEVEEGVEITVADNGPGVPQAEKDRIFEQFEQVTRGDGRTDTGAGLGLAVAKRLVEAMNGRIWYEPGFPVGASFRFTLPVGETERVLGRPEEEIARSRAIPGPPTT